MPLSAACGARFRRIELREDLSCDRLEDRLCGCACCLDGGIPQGASVQRLRGEYAGAAWPCRAYARSSALSGPAGFLPAQARLFPCRPGKEPLPPVAERRHVFSMRRLLRDLGHERSGICKMAYGGNRRGGDTGLALLSFRPGIRHRAILLREERRNAACRARPACRALIRQRFVIRTASIFASHTS